MRPFLGILAAALYFGSLRTGSAADHALGFDPCPVYEAYVPAEGGTITVYGVLELYLYASGSQEARARGWEVSVVVEGAEIVAEETFGVPGADPHTAPGIDLPVPLARYRDGEFLSEECGRLSSFGTLSPAELPGDPPLKGVVSKVSIDGGADRVVAVGRRVKIFALRLRVHPDRQVRLAFLDGLIGPEGPVTNRIDAVYGEATPDQFSCTFTPLLEVERLILSVLPASAPSLPEEGGFAVYEATLPSGRHRIPCLFYLTWEGLARDTGPEGWSLSVRNDLGLGLSWKDPNEGCYDLRDDPFSGLIVSTIFDHDGQPETPPLDPYEFDLSNADYRRAQAALTRKYTVCDAEPAPGVVTTVALNYQSRLRLKPNARHPLARVIYDVDVQPGPNPDLRIWYEDGLAAREGCSSPTPNDIFYPGGHAGPLETRGLILRLSGEGPWPGELFVRGDANADGRRNIGDPVTILGFLFLHDPKSLPCRKAADADDSGRLDISDGIYVLNHLFLGGPAPAQPFPGCGHDLATPDDLSCETFPPCR